MFIYTADSMWYTFVNYLYKAVCQCKYKEKIMVGTVNKSDVIHVQKCTENVQNMYFSLDVSINLIV